ncbi:hypothetical protein J5226_04360 [Lysobacter sp. K5869]|uniref:hypothetical protein n=1 Tax=Lysobacter sp. K5869 TaxID=2820808 RepID=UPI001C062D0C|nr:hypothetical protein [Lysobacter sp. K5869]QWP77651.1 hypothetical protein J5226_04360 [Lysobacter sp. K5869]
MKPLSACPPGSNRPSTFLRAPRRASAAILAASLLATLAACASSPANDPAAVTVLRVDAARFDDPNNREPALREACAAWRLNERQVAAFFASGREYPDGTHDAFYWLPCSIKGRLRAQGREWDFEINAAATATWTDGDTVRRWGCMAKACEPLVLLMPDQQGP